MERGEIQIKWAHIEKDLINCEKQRNQGRNPREVKFTVLLNKKPKLTFGIN